MNVYKIVDETGQFHLLVFQRKYEHGNGGIWTRSVIEIVALNVSYLRRSRQVLLDN
jgi:hypothetical protein